MAGQHTPGDWYLTRDGDLVVTDNTYIARILDGDHRTPERMSDEERAANARLIAKAPEMYDRIVAFLDYRQRNTANFQLEKADDYFNALRRILGEIEAAE